MEPSSPGTGFPQAANARAERPVPYPTPEGIARLQAAYCHHLGLNLSAEDAGRLLEQMMRFFIIHIDHELEDHELQSQIEPTSNLFSDGD